MRRRKRYIFYFFILAGILSASIVTLWVPQGSMIMGHDSGYRLFIPEFFRALFYTWTSTVNFGISTLYNPGVLPIHLPEYIFSGMFGAPQLVQRFVLIWWHMANLTAVFLASLFVWGWKSDSRLLKTSAIASVLYGINFYNLHAWSVLWRTKFSSQFVLPFLVFFLYETFRVRRIDYGKLVLLSVILSLFNGGGSPPLYGPLIISWAATGAYGIITSRPRLAALSLFVKVTVALVAVFSVLSAYWLVPYIAYAFSSYAKQLQAQGGIDSIAVIVDAVSKNASFLNIFRLQGLPAWDSGSPFPFMRRYVENPWLIAASFTFIVLAIGEMVQVKSRSRRRFAGLMLLLLLVGAFFTAGLHGPTGSLFKFMVYMVPGFAIFRTAFYKFGMIPWFALSMLVSISVVSWSERIAADTKKSRIGQYAVFGFMVFVLLYHLPFISGNFFDYNTPFTNKVTIPPYVSDVSDYIHSHTPVDAKILLMPRLYGDRMDGYEWGYWSPDPLPHMVINRAIVSDAYNSPPIVRAIYRAFYEKRFDDFSRLLAAAGIDLVLWRSDVLYADKVTNGPRLQYLEEDLKKITGIRMSKAFDQWRIYSFQSSNRLPSVAASNTVVRTDLQYEEYIDAGGAVTGSDAPPLLLSPEDSDNFPDMGGGRLIRAYCIWCDPKRRDLLEGATDFLHTPLLPDSKFYFLIRAKEDAVVLSKRVDPLSRARAYYSLIRVRISEIKRYVEIRSDGSQVHMAKNVEAIAAYLSEARRDIGRLPFGSKHEAAAEFITLLKGYQFVAGTLHAKGPSGEVLARLQDTLQAELSVLESETWYTTNQDRLLYMLDVSSSGTYKVSVRFHVQRPVSLLIDGIAHESDSVYLEKGVHRVEVIHLVPQAMKVSPERWLRESNSKDGSFEITVPVIGGNDYELSFDYQVNGDSNGTVIVATEYDVQPQTRTPDTAWALAAGAGRQRFRKTISVDSSASRVRFRFLSPTGHPSGMPIEGFSVSRVDIPRVYFFRAPGAPKGQSPSISYTYVSPTAYRVSVRDAVAPFVLHFNQVFDSSWNAYIEVPPGPKPDKMDKEEAGFQVKTNGYANGWVITRSGDFDIRLEHDPERFIRLGMMVTGAGLVLVAVFVLYHRKKERVRIR